MQFILTQEERDALVEKERVDKLTDAIALMRRMIVPLGKCIHDPGQNVYRCDNCPLSKGVDYKLSKLMCDQGRDYSK